jgi:hypothetical protein
MAGNLKPFQGKLKADSLFSFAIEFPTELRKLQDGGMFKFDLTKAEAIIGNFSYSSKTWIGEMVMISNNKEGNEQLVSTLNGLKMMGAAAGPEVGELINNIQLSANADSIVLKMKVTEELAKKLKEMAEKKSKGMGMM